MKSYDIFLHGEFVKSKANDVIKVVNPATDEVVSEVPACTPEDARQAVASSKEAQKKWRRIPQIERASYLKKMVAEIRKNAESLGRIITEEQGKTLSHATGEVHGAADLMEYHAEWARRIEGEILPSDSPNENVFLYKEPLGVVACILPWNFPFYVMLRKVAPALITGNSVVLKPSSETPNSALEFGKIVERAGLPPGVINIITGKGSMVGKELSTNPDVGMITLTGSTESGQSIMRAAAENVAKVSLELGGKAPAIVMNDANLDLAVRCIVNGRVSNAGQICNCVERVYVQEKVAEEFIGKVVAAMESVTFGDGMAEPAPDIGPLINHAAVKSVHSMVERAVAQGAVVLTGGYVPKVPERGSFYVPTVLGQCRQDMEIMRQEIFGPVMPIMVFKTAAEALELANDCEYGLTSTLYTENINTAMEFANHIEFGELFINRKQGEAYNGFHAGWKKSGIGGDDGKHGMEEFLQTRVVYIEY